MFNRTFCSTAILLFLTLLSFSGRILANEDGLKFQPDDKLSSRTPSWVEVGLPETVSESDLLEGLNLPKDAKLWFGSFIFGDANTQLVPVLKVDHESTCQLYIDTNRNRKLSDETPLVASTKSKQWVTELVPSVKNYESNGKQKVRVDFSWDIVKQTLRKTTAGVMMGTTKFAGQDRIVKLVDQNHNGRWLDAEDRVLLDVNGNGKISRITEQFPCAGMLKIRNELFAVKYNASTTNVIIQPVTTKGQIVAKLALGNELGLVNKIKAVLKSESGIQVVVEDMEKPVVCPIGMYQVAELSVGVMDSDQHYWFQFLRNGPGDYDCEVRDNEQTSIELLGNIRLNAQISRMTAQDEDILSVTPSLTTENGMYLANAKCGRTSAVSENRLKMKAFSSSSLTRSGSSGFS